MAASPGTSRGLHSRLSAWEARTPRACALLIVALLPLAGRPLVAQRPGVDSAARPADRRNARESLSLLRDTARLKPKPPSPAVARLVGEYSSGADTLIVLERSDKPYGILRDRETALSPVQFTPDDAARARSVRLGTRTFGRSAVGTEEGVTFRVTPLRPVDDLRREALASVPPAESGSFRTSNLVEVVALEAGIHLDIRYASANNFLGAPMYSSARAFLQAPAARALVRVHRALAAYGYGLLIHDAYRPWYVTRMFWDATSGADHEFVANPSTGSRHNRGAAVDLTMYDRQSGRAVRMTGGYDEFSHRSYAAYPGGTALERWQRDLLRREMETAGFTVNPSEWWHFDYDGWKEYPLLNVRFEQVRVSR